MDFWQTLAFLNYLMGVTVAISYLSVSFSQVHYMVSDGLAYNPGYRASLTLCVTLSSLLCARYFYLFDSDRARAGAVLSLLSCAFWWVLAFQFDYTVHVTGTALFISCTMASTVCQYLVSKNPNGADHGDYDLAYMLLLFITLVLVVTYVGLYLSPSVSNQAWIPEHMSLILFLSTQAGFFWIHPFRVPVYRPIPDQPPSRASV
jgi:hypothetical protein